MYTINDAYIEAMNEGAHNLRAPVDRSRGQIDNIISICQTIQDKTGKEIIFDNTYSNHYKLIIDDRELEFTVYKDVINALNLILLFL